MSENIINQYGRTERSSYAATLYIYLHARFFFKKKWGREQKCIKNLTPCFLYPTSARFNSPLMVFYLTWLQNMCAFLRFNVSLKRKIRSLRCKVWSSPTPPWFDWVLKVFLILSGLGLKNCRFPSCYSLLHDSTQQVSHDSRPLECVVQWMRHGGRKISWKVFPFASGNPFHSCKRLLESN